ncbi:hypothetical protein SLA2020_485790 [Shorea laevis]
MLIWSPVPSKPSKLWLQKFLKVQPCPAKWLPRLPLRGHGGNTSCVESGWTAPELGYPWAPDERHDLQRLPIHGVQPRRWVPSRRHSSATNNRIKTVSRSTQPNLRQILDI